MFRVAPERLVRSISTDDVMSRWSLDRASSLLEEAEDGQFERLMRAVEASPETRAGRWLEYGEDEWAADLPVPAEAHRRVLGSIGFEVRGIADCSYEDAQDETFGLTMDEGYESPEAMFSTAMSLPASERTRWLEAAAICGHPAAQYELANALVIASRDITPQSMRWVVCSAESGHPEACSAVGYCILSRKDGLEMIGRESTAEDALKLIWYAAAKGDATARENLSRLGASGLCGLPHVFWRETGKACAGLGDFPIEMFEGADRELKAPRAVRKKRCLGAMGQTPFYTKGDDEDD